jgi:hypothetical protein
MFVQYTRVDALSLFCPSRKALDFELNNRCERGRNDYFRALPHSKDISARYHLTARDLNHVAAADQQVTPGGRDEVDFVFRGYDITCHRCGSPGTCAIGQEAKNGAMCQAVMLGDGCLEWDAELGLAEAIVQQSRAEQNGERGFSDGGMSSVGKPDICFSP